MSIISAPRVVGRFRRPGRSAQRAGTRGAIAPLVGLLPVALVVMLWEVLGDPTSFAFPPPSRWLERMQAMQDEGLVIPATLHTLRTFGLGLSVAVLLGVVLGAAIGSSRRVSQAVSPVADFFRALPPPVIVAVVMLVVGLGLQAGLLIIVTGAFWPIMLNTAVGVRSMSPLRAETSRVLGLSRARHVRKVLMPSLTPHVLLGLKVAAAVAFVITLYIELLGVTDGLGNLLVTRQRRYDSGGTWALIFLVGILGYLISIIISLMERFSLRNWPR